MSSGSEPPHPHTPTPPPHVTTRLVEGDESGRPAAFSCGADGARRGTRGQVTVDDLTDTLKIFERLKKDQRINMAQWTRATSRPMPRPPGTSGEPALTQEGWPLHLLNTTASPVLCIISHPSGVVPCCVLSATVPVSHMCDHLRMSQSEGKGVVALGFACFCLNWRVS